MFVQKGKSKGAERYATAEWAATRERYELFEQRPQEALKPGHCRATTLNIKVLDQN